jgi:pilus assembly protein CpaB
MAERRYSVLLYTAVLTAIAATYGVYQVIQKTKAKSQVATRPVVVATKELGMGTALSLEDVEVKQWPIAAIPSEAYAKPDSLVGRVMRVQIFKGEPIVAGRLMAPGSAAGLAVKITPGKRGMGLKINDVAGIAGLIQPDSRVDIIVAVDKGEGHAPQSKLFMQDMRVLSIGTHTETGRDGKAIKATIATLEVTPGEAEKLQIAADQGTIQLALRGYGDSTTVKTTGAKTSDVLKEFSLARQESPAPRRSAPRKVEKKTEEPPPPPPVVVAPAPPKPKPPKPESSTVIIYRGGKTDKTKFAKDTSKAKKDSTQDTTSSGGSL